MKKTANVEPLERKRSIKVLEQGEKLKRLSSRPLHEKLGQPTKNRLKRLSLNHQYKDLRGAHEDILNVLCDLLAPPNWRPDQDAQIHLSVPGITSRDQLPDDLRTLTLAMIENRHPHTAWIHVYTDVVAEEAVRNGGSGVYVRFADGERSSISVPAGKLCSNFRADVLAINTLQSSSQNVGKAWTASSSLLIPCPPCKPLTLPIQTS